MKHRHQEKRATPETSPKPSSGSGDAKQEPTESAAKTSPEPAEKKAADTSGLPDVKLLGDDKSLPQVTFPGNANQTYRVFFEPKVHEAVWAHAKEETSVEICGVLVGRYVRDPDGPFVLIDGSI